MKQNPNFKSGGFNPRIFLAFAICLVGVLLAMLGFAAPTKSVQGTSKFKPLVVRSIYNGVSPKLRDLPVIKKPAGPPYVVNPIRPIRPPHAPPTLPVTDPVKQTVAAPLAMPTPIQTFEGMNQADGCGSCIPPDPNGAVGPNHYAEMVNSSFAIYSKTGTKLTGPTDINLLWSALPGPCKDDNDGDPVVLYDHLADRWVLTQFAVPGGAAGYDECVAVSQTNDPTGSYYVYDFHLSDTVFHDYPHLGVWPDAYYMTTNEFDGTTSTFLGAGAFAFERDKMLLGQPARMVFFDESTVNGSFGGMLPSYLDGPPPPLGSPNYFAEVDSIANTPSLGADAMRIWKFHVDWSNTSLSTFGNNGQPNFTLPVASWTPSQCVVGVGTCVPQLGSPYQLDVIGDRIMYRLAYRNFGDHESLVMNHSVLADARIGVRWYEVRNLSSVPSIYQQSTFAPTDTLYRWMGSIAMDRIGNIAVAYSTSSPTTFPSLAYAGRLATDPLNALSQGETQLFAGLGAENVAFYVPPTGRWGDYSALTVDPTDGCTFWYVNEYFGAEGTTDPGAPWRTRIGSFKFANCVAAITPISAVSVKTHGTTDFPIDLLPPAPGIEMRKGQGTNPNSHKVVVTFAQPVTITANPKARVTSGIGTIESVNVSGAVVTVNLTAANAQRITITLFGVQLGATTADVNIPMAILLADVNQSTGVNSGDVFLLQQQNGQALPPVGSADFRRDLNENGIIDSGDVFIGQKQNPSQLPP